VLRSIFSTVVALVTIFVLTFLMVLQGPNSSRPGSAHYPNGVRNGSGGALLAIPVAGVLHVIGRDLYDGYRGRLKPDPTTGTDEVPVSRHRSTGRRPRGVSGRLTAG
jgi:predicted PurR-regulated permease PerM